MFQTISRKYFEKAVIYPLVLLLLNLSLLPSLASAQGVQIELEPVTAAIKGKDVSIHCRVSQEVDEVKLFIRKLLDLGPFNDLPMEKTGAVNYRLTLPLSQESGEIGRLEYYLEAYKGGQAVAKTESYVISFVEAPFIGEVGIYETPGLDRAAWKDFMKGRVKRPLFKRWWVWAILGGVGIGATALLVGGSTEAPPAPPSISFVVADEARRDTQFTLLCEPQQIPMTLAITGMAQGPFDVIFTMARPGGNREVQVATSPPVQLTSNDTVIFTQSFETTGTFTIQYPTVEVLGSATGPATLRFLAIVKDGVTDATFGGVSPGSPLPTTIRNLIQEDDRVIQQIAFDVMFQGASGCN